MRRSIKHTIRSGFTMVEVIVALGVASILMVGIVAFLVNGAVSAQKTTIIVDMTTKGRHIFEHVLREVARANDVTVSNFATPDPNYVAPPTPIPGSPGQGYQGFTYRIDVGGQAITVDTPVINTSVTLNLAASSGPEYLVPQAGDYLQLPGLILG